MGTNHLNHLGMNRPSWVRIVWVRTIRRYEMSGKRCDHGD